MRRIVILIIESLLSFICKAQVTIIMEEDGGVYKIPCLVNGAKMKLIFDTGASTVCLSETMAEYLLENEYLSKEDFVGTGKSSVADGRIVNNLHLNIRDIEISGLHLLNVEAVVIEGQKAPLLLGQTAISKLGRITINGNTLIIEKGTSDIDARVDELINKGMEYMNDRLYGKAKECFDEAYAHGGLTEYGLYVYSRCCMFNKDFSMAKRAIDEVTDYQYFLDREINIYNTLAWVYEYNGLFDDAIAYYTKAINANVPVEKKYEDAAYYAYCIGVIHYNRKNFSEAVRFFQASIKAMELHYNLRPGYLTEDCMGSLKSGEKSFRNEEIDRYMFYWVEASDEAGLYTPEAYVKALCTLARNGNALARQKCNSTGINYMLY